MKVQLTRESVLAAVSAGAKSFTAVSKLHGYKGSVSSGTARAIRQLVPEIAELFAGNPTMTPVVPAVPTMKVVVVKAAKPKAVAKAKAVKPAKETKLAVNQSVKQRSRPYAGKVYGPVFAAAVAAGSVVAKEFIPLAANQLGLTEEQVKFATQVIRNPNHITNGQRSKDVAEKRGVMQVVGIEIVAAVEG